MLILMSNSLRGSSSGSTSPFPLNPSSLERLDGPWSFEVCELDGPAKRRTVMVDKHLIHWATSHECTRVPPVKLTDGRGHQLRLRITSHDGPLSMVTRQVVNMLKMTTDKPLKTMAPAFSTSYTGRQPPSFGHQLLDYFSFDPGYINLNNGQPRS